MGEITYLEDLLGKVRIFVHSLRCTAERNFERIRIDYAEFAVHYDLHKPQKVIEVTKLIPLGSL